MSTGIDSKGYVQLVTSGDEVLMQAPYLGGELSYYEEKVWIVKDGNRVRHVDSSPLAQPFKFSKPLDRNALVTLYDDVYDKLPVDVEPKKEHAIGTYTAGELEFMSIEGELKLDYWNAFSNGVWVGTSEY